jgi:integrase
MNGWINEARSRPPDRWKIILDLGPQAGKKGRKQKWITYRGTKTDAKKKLRDLIGQSDRGEFVEPSKRTVSEWLDEWLLKVVKPKKSPRTYSTYELAIRLHIKPKLGAIPLQQLKAVDVDQYHGDVRGAGLSAATCKIHHNILSSALKLALRDGLVHRNVASQTSPPKQTVDHDVVKAWTAEEARKILAAAKGHGPQTAALFATALDSGARRGELQGLRWTDVDLTTRAMRISRQLSGQGEDGPTFGPTKTRKVRTLDLSAETVALLREHKRQQAELKLANRLQYKDHGLIFAQAWEHQNGRNGCLGAPLNQNAIARTLERLIVDTEVRRINVHGLRHTSATLLLAAGVPSYVVQQRLGHSSIGTTLNQYAHVLPSQQADAASKLAALIY